MIVAYQPAAAPANAREKSILRNKKQCGNLAQKIFPPKMICVH
jgi:hypothetical protein